MSDDAVAVVAILVVVIQVAIVVAFFVLVARVGEIAQDVRRIRSLLATQFGSLEAHTDESKPGPDLAHDHPFEATHEALLEHLTSKHEYKGNSSASYGDLAELHDAMHTPPTRSNMGPGLPLETVEARLQPLPMG